MSSTAKSRHARLEARRARRRARSSRRSPPLGVWPTWTETRRAERDRQRVGLYTRLRRERREDATRIGVETFDAFYKNLRTFVSECKHARRAAMLTRRDQRELAGYPERQPLSAITSTHKLSRSGAFVPRPKPSPGPNRRSRRDMMRVLGAFPSGPPELRPFS